MARSARDCAAMLQVIAGYDGSDPTCRKVGVPEYLAALTGDLHGVRVAIEREHHTRAEGVLTEAVDAFERAVGVLESVGALTTEVVIPHYAEITFASRVQSRAEAAAFHMLDLRTRWLDYGIHTRDAVAQGALYAASDVVQAQRVRQYAKKLVGELMRPFDVMVTLSSGRGAPPVDGLSTETFSKYPSFTSFWNGMGLPALCIPFGFTEDGLPLSMQIVGKPFDEATVLRVGDAFQQVTDWHLQVPGVSVAEALAT